MNLAMRQTQIELDYAKYNLLSLISLFSYDDKSMIQLNKTRAISSIDCIMETLKNTKEYIEKDC